MQRRYYRDERDDWTGFITTNLGDDFNPAYVLLVTGCDCLFSGEIQTLKLFSFLIRLPLYINQTCKYSFQSYVWIVLYQLRLATEKNKRQKKRKKIQDNPENPQKSHVVLYLHSFLRLLVNECVTQLQSNTH